MSPSHFPTTSIDVTNVLPTSWKAESHNCHLSDFGAGHNRLDWDRSCWSDCLSCLVVLAVLLLVAGALHARQRAAFVAQQLKLGGHLVLRQREAHRQRRHAEQHVRADSDQLVLVLGLRQRRNHVAETDRRNGYEAVVRGRVYFPALPESNVFFLLVPLIYPSKNLYRVTVSRPSRHKIGYFGDALSSQSFGQCRE